MPHVREAVVVGAGINGASAAFHLSERGVDVAILDRAYPASGPTGSSSAITHVFYLLPELSQLGHRGCEQLRTLPDRVGEPSGYDACGMMWACGPESAPSWAEAVRRIEAEGARIESLEPSALAERAPAFAVDDGVAMLIWEPDGGYADPATATTSLVRAAEARGAGLGVNAEVTGIDVAGGRVRGVRLANGERYAAETVILAAGPWTTRLLGPLGIDLPLSVERHAMAVLDARDAARQVLPFSWCDDVLLNYGRPDGENVILLGGWAGGGTGVRHEDAERGESLEAPERVRRTVGLAESEGIVRSFLQRIPGIADLGVRPGYADLYDMSPDDNPLIGRLEIEGLYVVAGTSGHGFKLGPAVGEEVARLVVDGDAPLLSPFDPYRTFDGGA